MEPDQDGNTPTTEPIRFRAGKKRKAYRQRPTEEEDSHDVATVIPAPSVLPGASKVEDGEPGRDAIANAEKLLRELEGEDGNGDDEDDRMDGESAVAAALRLRNARRAARRGGVGFRSEGRNQDDEDADAEKHALVLRDADKDAAHDRIVGGITNRFMHQTGLLTILDDKHMNEYIESRLASRSADPHGTSPSSSQPASQSATTNQGLAGDPNHQDKWRDQPTRHGKLVEVDMANLDNGARNNNGSDSNKRRRVETDGVAKPPPRRGRNRRNSQDIARDALVEQFLHENRLDVYNVPSSSTAVSSAPGGDPSADDRLAEEFRQQYYDEQAMRRKKKRPVQQQKQQQQQSGDVLKGPKLGGSRNMRAAVRDKLLQQEKEKKGR